MGGIGIKDVFESGEKIGWVGIVALGVILFGLFFLHGTGLFTADPDVWLSDSRRGFGLALLLTGILILIAALASSASSLKRADPDGVERAKLQSQVATLQEQIQKLQVEKSQVQGRRTAYRDAWNIIRAHKALSFLDDPEFIRKVIRSNEDLRKELDELLKRGNLDDYSQEFIVAIRTFAKDFWIDCEQLERERVLPTKEENPDLRLSDLPSASSPALPDARSRVIDFHRHWTMRTKALFSGAASMLGIEPPKFDW